MFQSSQSQSLLAEFNKQNRTRNKIDRHFLSLTESVDTSPDICGTFDDILSSTESTETTAEAKTTETAGIEDNNGNSSFLSFRKISL